jgi:phosphoglycolate phosphatase-like HAD superfamily hydrolase
MSPGYQELENALGARSYVRLDRFGDIGDIDVVVFDCDGVLLDVRESYSTAVTRTMSIIVKAVTGCDLPDGLLDGRLNYAYKRTGGFNNDWSLTYALTMRILSELPEKQIRKLDEVAGESLKYDTSYERFRFLRRNRIQADVPVEQLYEKLYEFAYMLDSTGVEAVDSRLLVDVGLNIKSALNYPGEVGESIVSTLFEEIFGGVDLFQLNYGLEAKFTSNRRGLIEKEKVVVTEATIERLTELLGGNRIGIASGSPSMTGRYALGDIINLIREDAQVWYDTVEEAQREEGVENLHKPSPYSLVRASEPFRPYESVLYVGDSMADRLMALNAGEPEFLFAGIYGNVHGGDEARGDFLKEGSDIVAPTVNDLPEIIERVRGESF